MGSVDDLLNGKMKVGVRVNLADQKALSVFLGLCRIFLEIGLDVLTKALGALFSRFLNCLMTGPMRMSGMSGKLKEVGAELGRLIGKKKSAVVDFETFESLYYPEDKEAARTAYEATKAMLTEHRTHPIAVWFDSVGTVFKGSHDNDVVGATIGMMVALKEAGVRIGIYSKDMRWHSDFDNIPQELKDLVTTDDNGNPNVRKPDIMDFGAKSVDEVEILVDDSQQVIDDSCMSLLRRGIPRSEIHKRFLNARDIPNGFKAILALLNEEGE